MGVTNGYTTMVKGLTMKNKLLVYSQKGTTDFLVSGNRNLLCYMVITTSRTYDTLFTLHKVENIKCISYTRSYCCYTILKRNHCYLAGVST